MRRLAILSAMAALALPGLLRADADKPVTLDPKVSDVLSKAAAFYSSQKTVEADLGTAMNISSAGMKQEMDSSFHLALAQPNLFALTLQSGMMGGTMVCDGKTLSTYVPTMDKYTQAPAPDSLSDLLNPMAIMLVGGSPYSMQFGNFFRRDALKDFEDGLTSSQDFGPDKIGAIPAHRVELAYGPFITDFWIADGPTPTLLQTRTAMDMSGTLKKLAADQRKKLAAASGMTMSTTVTYSNWKYNQPIAADAFVFHAPGNAQLVTEFMPGAKNPLVGHPAPDFSLLDLDGKKVSLFTLRGKVVVLDFWATWCGPCVETLPKVIKATAAFQDQDVVFYAVNLREKADDIRKFQSTKQLNFPVLLDSDGKLADLYGAKAIPQTVIIDKTGKIQVIHVGYDVSLDKTITKQLTDLLAGKPLVQESAAAPAPSQ